eukprot:TRINITY_DN4939_c0_g3_i2.p1 TRINITY_DN4939_c0_g3~~TRINITY_DN4939_c0_g3_i2.p1  ORF type:complete len:161 (-),score=46.61 TRINITY_DN4939_c0_g3_i2:94-528(-)
MCIRDSQRRVHGYIAEAGRNVGETFMYDFSISLTHFYEIVDIMRKKLEGKAVTLGFGHIGDGNLHLQASCIKPEYKNEVESILEPFVYDWVKEKGGSISAEHGVGLAKLQILPQTKESKALDYMKQLKQIFDPNEILNPYKVLL